MLGPTKYWVEQIFGSKEKFGPKKVSKMLGPNKNCRVQKIEGPKLFGSKQILGLNKISGPTKYVSQIILRKKK